MTAVIFGVGIGLVILISVWLIAICNVLLWLRTKRNIGNITLIIATLFTIILLVIPLDTRTPNPQIYRVYDEVFIWRSSLLILLAISSVFALLAYIGNHLMESHVEHSIKSKRF